MRRLLILIAVIAIPLSLIAGPVVQAASAHVSSPADAKASQKTVIVPATQPWTDTGISLPVGTVSFKASGTINVQSGNPAFNNTPAGQGPADPGCIGNSDTPWGDDWTAEGLPCWSLIGRLGNGSPFEIGDGGTFRVLRPGVLYLGVNDQADAFGDNSGSWTVQISWTPAGQQSLQLNVPFDTELGSVPGYPGSGKNNCGPASVTMAIQFYGGSTTVAASAIAIRGTNNGKNGVTDFKPGDTTGDNTVTWLAKFGLTEKNVTTLSGIRTELAAGHPVIILVSNYAYRYDTPPPYSSNDGGWFTTGHIVVVTGINSANVIINDPLRLSSNYAIPLATFESAASTAQPDGINGPTTGSTWYAASILRG